MTHQTEIFHLNSDADGLLLEGTLVFPSGAPKGIVQISHGMAEHRQRYLPFLDFLADAGYIGAIHAAPKARRIRAISARRAGRERFRIWRRLPPI